jgi:hypothetical protein
MIFLSKDLKIIEKKNFHLRRNGSFSVPLKIKGLSQNAHLNLLYDFTYVYSSLGS